VDASIPEIAMRFPLPPSVGSEVRRYGFHGLSYQYIVDTYEVARRGNVVVAHLGSGASLCALHDGISIDTSMGMSPLGGLMMGTRPGDLDHEQSGLLGVSGTTADVRVLEQRYESDERARTAIDLFTYIARKQIGGMIAALDSIDALIFTGGIGEHSRLVRDTICVGLTLAGIGSHVPVHVLATDENRAIARHVYGVLSSPRS
jgi:acetate kinase